eukprot:EW708050.1.p3 GENE.EW708050.1~~EW708050.1.p3  ORF type:complete len:63 (+),score=5.64 EW708050.1:116-304(+)
MYLLSLLHILLAVFGVFIWQDLPVYYACRGKNRARYIIFFITQSLRRVYSLLMIAGIPQIGS